ncbi:MAG: aminotransferase class I/II-fold pyridoxal phosphate-dependent enzyme [Bauldia sp.]|nr:aminotransferase class I/II-fold pyridoxal phosphate-dependent enzyme [Bauldia sp.]
MNVRQRQSVSRRSDVRPFVAMDVLAEANRREAAGERIIHMEVGQPSAPAPAAVLAAARRAVEAGRLAYTEALGITPLRERIARHYRDAYGVEVAPGRIAVTTGSSGGFMIAFLAAFDAGDRIAMASPGYPAYRNIIAALGLEAVEIPVGPETRYALTPAQLEQAHADKPLAGVLIASPANPSGTMMAPDAIAALAAAAGDLGIRLVSDEIYHGLVYDGVADTAIRHSPDAIVVNSFSKYYCMAGWRVGWMVLPPDLVRPAERLTQNLYISAPDLSQRAAVAAFDSTAELDAVKAGYAASRSLLLDRLPALGFDDRLPVDGAFYVYASVRRFTNDSHDFARRMLAEAGVAATPGLDFDTERGNGMIRFSFAGATASMAEAMDRLTTWLG